MASKKKKEKKRKKRKKENDGKVAKQRQKARKKERKIERKNERKLVRRRWKGNKRAIGGRRQKSKIRGHQKKVFIGHFRIM